jgi:hypothetical protein
VPSQISDGNSTILNGYSPDLPPTVSSIIHHPNPPNTDSAMY